MPNKYPKKKGWNIPKQRYKVTIGVRITMHCVVVVASDIWLSDDLSDCWYEKARVYDGHGAPQKFTDVAIFICHQIG